jgi:hypothetical protein
MRGIGRVCGKSNRGIIVGQSRSVTSSANKSPGSSRPEVRKEEAVTRHFRLSCVAQSVVQRAASSGGKSERLQFAEEKATVGQKVFTIAHQALGGVLQFVQGLFAQGLSCDQVLQGLMPT